jgi:hypothetical protein
MYIFSSGFFSQSESRNGSSLLSPPPAFSSIPRRSRTELSNCQPEISIDFFAAEAALWNAR